jgi:NAD(P)H dehydrogenase (quinone)
MKVLVVYYSMYGHTMKLAQAAKEGAESVKGTEVMLRRVAEFPEVREQIQKNEHSRAVWEKQKDVPECQLDDLRQADGLILGTPTRYGNMTAQVKRLIDSTVQLWLEGAMEGKPAGLLASTATTHGGQETTLLCTMVPLLHLGMVIVGVPYSTAGMLHTEGRGGTPYGATTVTGPNNDLQPKAEDLEIARALGKRVAGFAASLKGSRKT